MGISIIPLISCVVSFIFGITVLDQYFARRRSYQLVWAIGILMYAVSTGAELAFELGGLNETVLKFWYLFGAIFVAAYLGQGTVYLLARRRTAHIATGILLAASIYAAVSVFTAAVDLNAIEELSGKAFPTSIRLMTPVFNIYGTVTLVGGAIYSAWIFWRKRILPHRVVSNVLIAVGAILPAFGGTIMRFWDTLAVLYLLEVLGIVIIFIGFLRSHEIFGLFRFPLIHGFKKIAE